MWSLLSGAAESAKSWAEGMWYGDHTVEMQPWTEPEAIGEGFGVVPRPVPAVGANPVGSIADMDEAGVVEEEAGAIEENLGVVEEEVEEEAEEIFQEGVDAFGNPLEETGMSFQPAGNVEVIRGGGAAAADDGGGDLNWGDEELGNLDDVAGDVEDQLWRHRLGLESHRAMSLAM